MTDGPVTWRELLRETVSLVSDPVHARWICEAATATTSDEFRALLDTPATQRAVHQLDAMVARTRAGEPIQYVIGSWGFRRLDLAVDRRVLIPRPETESLVELAVEKATAFTPTRTLVDLGTGSGAIGLALADELPIMGTMVWITDIDGDALDVARANLAGLGRAAVNVRIGEGSWFDALPPDERFDVIASNPPYVAEDSPDLESIVAEWEPERALLAGSDGLADIRLIVAGAFDRLRPKGWLVLEHGHDQGAAVAALAADRGYVDVESRNDLAGRTRMTMARRP